MSKALAVQSSRLALNGARGYGTACRRGASATTIVKETINAKTPTIVHAEKKCLHTTAMKAAVVSEGSHRKQTRGMSISLSTNV